MAGARVYLHTRARRHYVAAVLGPAIDRLRIEQEAHSVHLVSGWRFGPHFELSAAARPGGPINWPDVAARLAQEAAHFPTPEPQRFECEYLRQAEVLGRLEQVPPPYGPVRPHGDSEVLAPHQASVSELGLPALLDPIVESAGAPSDGVLQARVAEAFLALASTHPFGVRFGTFSFRSHAEAFIHWAAPRADYRTAFESRRRADRRALTELVERARHGAFSDSGGRWRDGFAACQTAVEGRVTLADLERMGSATDPVATPAGGSATSSPFHQAVAASGVLEQVPEWFAGFRLTINLFYQLLPALDLSPIRRFYLCYAVAETLDEVLAEPWQDRLAAVAEHLAASP